MERKPLLTITIPHTINQLSVNHALRTKGYPEPCAYGCVKMVPYGSTVVPQSGVRSYKAVLIAVSLL